MTTYRELDLSLTADQQKLKLDMQDFSKSVLRPAALALDRLPDPQQVIDPGLRSGRHSRPPMHRVITPFLFPKPVEGWA